MLWYDDFRKLFLFILCCLLLFLGLCICSFLCWARASSARRERETQRERTSYLRSRKSWLTWWLSSIELRVNLMVPRHSTGPLATEFVQLPKICLFARYIDEPLVQRNVYSPALRRVPSGASCRESERAKANETIQAQLFSRLLFPCDSLHHDRQSLYRFKLLYKVEIKSQVI